MIRAMLMVLLLAGCAAPKPITVTKIKLVEPQIPPTLLTCPNAPVVPAATSQAVVANYIVALWKAGALCRNHLAAIQHMLAKPSS
jgi:hypothetical protein